MHVFLTGATGFVGSYVLQALLDAGHTVRCLVRDADASLDTGGREVERVKGDVTNPKSLAGTMRGCDAVIHLVGIIDESPSKGVTFEAIHREGTRHVVKEARASGIGRFVHMSANGARPDGVSRYQSTKYEAEEIVRTAGFARWTILRPSIVFGDPGPDRVEFASRLAAELVDPFPVLPVFGDGRYELQPVSVEEVAQGFVQALTLAEASGQTYCVAGHERYAFVDVLDLLARALGGEPKPKLPQPLWLVRPLIGLADPLGVLPISRAQFEMLVEGNTCDETAFYRDFDLDYRPFTLENLAYVRERV